ncbi:MAG: hypothetical protein J0I49_35055 [Pseudonocardia sp.]|uniref:hypothetical protein n=1 Tax=Pseudonocardia sp. TaxID=60912 RepID=UPI001AC09129|nr:hypothetical protein [Pseudonocardia sp.]MBN9103276.1 hypothetical protein [Pseudonocardia sp.]
MNDWSYPDRLPNAVLTPFNNSPWVALSHGSAGPDIHTADTSLDEADEALIAELAGQCDDAAWDDMYALAMSFNTDPTPEWRTDVSVVYRDPSGNITHTDAGDLALNQAWHQSTETLASIGVQKAGAAERLGRYGYDPLDGSYEDRSTDDGLRAMPDSGAAARARMVELARESHHGQTAAHHTRSESFNPTVVTAPATYMHGDGSPIIGRDGQPLWQDRHDVDVEPEFTTADAAVLASFDDREALAHQALRNLGMRP